MEAEVGWEEGIEKGRKGRRMEAIQIPVSVAKKVTH